MVVCKSYYGTYHINKPLVFWYICVKTSNNNNFSINRKNHARIDKGPSGPVGNDYSKPDRDDKLLPNNNGEWRPNKSDKTRSTGSLIIIYTCIFSSCTIGIVTTMSDREYRKRRGGGGGVASSRVCPAPVSLACFYHSSVLFACVCVRRACVCVVLPPQYSMETSCPPPPPHIAV